MATRPVRVTSRKHGGDDRYSWAVFVDDVPKWVGLTKPEASYYVAVERKRLGVDKEAARKAVIR